jgi:hypothetical protein
VIRMMEGNLVTTKVTDGYVVIFSTGFGRRRISVKWNESIERLLFRVFEGHKFLKFQQ